MTEVPPLFVVEFLHRVVDTLNDYFGDCSESIVKENCVVVYELLDEMLGKDLGGLELNRIWTKINFVLIFSDNGFPLATESNILKEVKSLNST